MNQNSTSHYIKSKLRELNLEGKQDETFEQVNKNIENNKNNIHLYRKKANLLSQLGKLQEVLHTWEQGIQNNIHDINFYQEKGIPYFTIYQLKYQGIRVNRMRLSNYMILVQQKMLKMFHFIFQNVSDQEIFIIFEKHKFKDIIECWDQGIQNNTECKIYYIQKCKFLHHLYSKLTLLKTFILQLMEFQIMKDGEKLQTVGVQESPIIKMITRFIQKMCKLQNNQKNIKKYWNVQIQGSNIININCFYIEKKVIFKCIEKMGKDQEIIDNYDQGIQIMVHPGIYEEKAIALTKQQKWKEVIQFCNCDKQKLSNYFFLVKIQIQALSELNEQDQLIKLCNEFIQMISQALFKLGLLEQVIESWDEAIKKMKKYKNFMLNKLKPYIIKLIHDLLMNKIDIQRLFEILILQSICNQIIKQKYKIGKRISQKNKVILEKLQ
ncbi:unnamed protein product [Paramecium pentaurelia]|uniref:Uncharacterized protein n=1 Tax=Paramecium pentaurelia TaxID=43138 RepID=A0A8S1WVZ5_9CILI|nr:unnamed protein product [Paramecium pentaurelia]